MTLTVGTEPKRLILGFMLGTAFVSMWVSNTASTMMMIPVALAVLSQLSDDRENKFGTALTLGVACAALIALMMTFLTELTSNTATSLLLLPILAGVAQGIGIHPYPPDGSRRDLRFMRVHDACRYTAKRDRLRGRLYKDG